MESVHNSGTSLIDPRDLLLLLRRQQFSLPFNLSYCADQGQPASLRQAVLAACSPPQGNLCCSRDCQQIWQCSLDKALYSKSPQTLLCPQRFLGFVVPLQCGEDSAGFLFGGGLREKITQPAPTSPAVDHGSAPQSVSPFRQIATATTSEMAAAADEIYRTLPQLLGQQLHSLGLVRMTKSLESARLLARDVAACTSVEDAIGVTAEALAVLFDIPRVLIRVGLPGLVARTRVALGFSPGELEQVEQKLSDICAPQSPADTSPEEVRMLFHAENQAGSAYFAPLADGGQTLGVAVLLDADLHQRDRALCDLILDRLAARLQQLKLEECRRREHADATRLVGMVSALSMMDTQQELYHSMLAMSAELCGAESGSLMLVDESAATLNITVAIGMSGPVAQAVTIPVGEGIAGRVFQGGQPLMVNDIERDARFATRNRPRFKTKSFLCLPLKSNGHFIGVLNLADKTDGSSFTEADLHLLQSFLTHAVQLIKRTAFLERVGLLEKLSITDPLTGLFNRRFLEGRLEEEINRSQRQKQTFSLILADLDNFKTYNDVLGHLAGDKALQKVAELLRGTAREMDIVTRYGGEEFCLVLPGTGKKESLFVAERLRRAIEVAVFPGESHLPLGRLTISLGVAAYPDDGRLADTLVHAADLALYRAKHNGRNRLVLYRADLSQTLASPLRVH